MVKCVKPNKLIEVPRKALKVGRSATQGHESWSIYNVKPKNLIEILRKAWKLADPPRNHDLDHDNKRIMSNRQLCVHI